ncbi:hypothetical protein Cgig2_022515 [Carnegiea gigantea]|uniref:Uncharacterized protein n=1 Tax=Carnegiea gigantea TaxID=171969 RepID=A0A9Q1GLN5_9CARY|nr:hypothetical protein Cgig2_022515 [Carnegiea gigantea]
MTPGKLMLWFVCNFSTCSYSIPLAHDRIRVIEHDVHITLGLSKGPLEVIVAKNKSNANVDFKEQWPEHDSILKCGEVIDMMQNQEFEIRFSRDYLEDSLDKSIVTNYIEEVNDEELTTKVLKLKLKLKIKQESQRSRCATLNRIRKIVVKSPSDVFIKGALKKSKSRTLVLLPSLYESEALLIEIDMIRKHFMSSWDMVSEFSQFTPPSFNFRASQEEK